MKGKDRHVTRKKENKDRDLSNKSKAMNSNLTKKKSYQNRDSSVAILFTEEKKSVCEFQ
jgi:hypothetical protein